MKTEVKIYSGILASVRKGAAMRTIARKIDFEKKRRCPLEEFTNSSKSLFAEEVILKEGKMLNVAGEFAVP